MTKKRMTIGSTTQRRIKKRDMTERSVYRTERSIRKRMINNNIKNSKVTARMIIANKVMKSSGKDK